PGTRVVDARFATRRGTIWLPHLTDRNVRSISPAICRRYRISILPEAVLREQARCRHRSFGARHAEMGSTLEDPLLGKIARAAAIAVAGQALSMVASIYGIATAIFSNE